MSIGMSGSGAPATHRSSRTDFVEHAKVRFVSSASDPSGMRLTVSPDTTYRRFSGAAPNASDLARSASAVPAMFLFCRAGRQGPPAHVRGVAQRVVFFGHLYAGGRLPEALQGVAVHARVVPQIAQPAACHQHPVDGCVFWIFRSVPVPGSFGLVLRRKLLLVG